MKVDYLKAGSDDCPLIRLYDFSIADAQWLQAIFETLASGSVESTLLEEIESVDGTQLTLMRSSDDQGVIERSLNRFDIALTPVGWKQAAEFTEPFCKGTFGFQWLTPQTHGIQLLLSKTGGW